jgi:hypothetical protein
MKQLTIKTGLLLAAMVASFTLAAAPPAHANVVVCCWICQGTFCVHYCGETGCCGNQVCHAKAKSTHDGVASLAWSFEQAEAKVVADDIVRGVKSARGQVQKPEADGAEKCDQQALTE